MERILIYHTAAIGDAMLATPVACQLKLLYPQAQITYVTHDSLVPLLSKSKAIDNFIAVEKEASPLDLRLTMGKLKPDLLVDLSGSTKSKLNTAFIAKKTLRYKKAEDSMHAVDNYLDTISTLWTRSEETEIFPTLNISEEEKNRFRSTVPKENRRLIALVPGVGQARPHRAWPEESWITLAKHILWEKDHALILVGGMEERTICSRIMEKVGEYCFNLAGKLSLAETAVALASSDATVAGDTGPAHISVAAGTPVVGLYGPTRVERSGPYGYDELALSASDKCQCPGLKACKIADEGLSSGRCMKDIHMKVVYGNLSSLFPWNRLL